MTDYSEKRRYAEQYRWQLITDEACRQRRKAKRRTILQHFAAWSLVAVALYVFGPALIRTAQAIWRGI